MNVKVTQENLSKALGIVSRTASNRTTLPILNNILIRATNNTLVLSTTNLEVSTTETIPAIVTEQGVFTVPAKLMTEFILNLPKTTIEIEAKDNKVEIKSGGYKSTINTTPADDFPTLPDPEIKHTVSLSTVDFKKAISSTALVASSDNTRPILTGALLHSSSGFLYIVATDGYRLAEKKIAKNDAEISAIIPATTLNDVVRVIGDEADSVEISIGEDQVQFRVGYTIINSRLIDGKFINYEQLIPKDTETSATVNRAELLRITKISELFARESAGSITIKVDSKASTLSVHSIASELGENTAETEAEVRGDGAVTLNSKFLLDALNQIDDENIQLRFNGKLAPVLITAEGDADYRHIIMPVKS